MFLEIFPYDDLSDKQKENHNFQKFSAILADYGYSTTRLWDDSNGADFIATHANGKNLYKIQLKTRVYFDTKYLKKDLWIAFRSKHKFFIFPHDKILQLVLDSGRVMHRTISWEGKGRYSFVSISKWMEEILESYEIKNLNENKS